MSANAVHTAYISVGSNLGDKLANCRSAIGAVERLDRCSVTGCSRFFRTAPVDYLDQDWFVNAVIRIDTALSPGALLERLKHIQTRAGRTENTIRFGPRVIDLDIIFYDDAVVDTPELTIPHPRMHKRRFVLEPLCDIDPRIVHPVLQASVRALLGRIDDPGQEIIPLDD